MMGDVDRNTSFEILDYFYSQGGNFIDTSNNYQGEESETWIGEWMNERGVRDEMVIATKYTTFYAYGTGEKAIRSNFGGNSAKSLHVSVEASLKKLQTSYIDLVNPINVLYKIYTANMIFSSTSIGGTTRLLFRNLCML